MVRELLEVDKPLEPPVGILSTDTNASPTEILQEVRIPSAISELITDQERIAETNLRVAAAGGMLDGPIRVSFNFSGDDDIDLHVQYEELGRSAKRRAALVSTNRKTDGRGYEQLVAAFDRLSGTRIKTNLRTNGEEVTEGFGLIDSWRIIRHNESGRMLELKVNLSDWVFNAVLGSEVLTLHRNYFRLRKPLERRIYELARKHCGQQQEWSISLETLQKKSGAASTMKEFRRLVATIASDDAWHAHTPDYSITLDDSDNPLTKICDARAFANAVVVDILFNGRQSSPPPVPSVVTLIVRAFCR